MDPHLYGAHGRIRLFLEDLNAVLGNFSAPIPCGPTPTFNQIGFPQNLHGGFHQQSSWKRPTLRSRTWKEGHPKTHSQRSQSTRQTPPSVPSTNCFKFNSTPNASTAQCSASHRPVCIQGRHGPLKPQTVARSLSLQSSYRHQTVNDPREEDHRLLEEMQDASVVSDCDKSSIAGDVDVLIDSELSSELQDQPDLDDQPELEVELGPECCYPISTPAAPIELEVDPPHSHSNESKDGHQSNSVIGSILTTQTVHASSDNTAFFRPILTPAPPPDPVMTPRRPFVPSLRTPFVLRRPEERFSDHENEVLLSRTPRQRTPYRSFRLTPINDLRNDDSASEDEAPRPIFNRNQRFQPQDPRRHNNRRHAFNLRNQHPNNVHLNEQHLQETRWRNSYLHTHSLNNISPASHESSLSPQHSSSRLSEHHYPNYSDQSTSVNNNYDSENNNFNDSYNSENNYIDNDHPDFNDYGNTEFENYEAGCEEFDDGGSFDCYDEDF